MRFNAFILELTRFKQVLAIFGIMIWGKQDDGSPREGFTRHLLYISHDPIGWKYQVLFFSFHKTYALRHAAVMEAIRFPHGRPQQTGGLKAKGKVVPLGESIKESEAPKPAA